MRRGNVAGRHIGSLVFLLVVLLFGGACSWQGGAHAEANSQTLTTIYLVRHAEKGEGADPDLTVEGHARSRALADRLDASAIHRLWSSDYARTRQTLAPLSTRRQLPVTLYDAHDSAGLIRSIMDSPPGLTHVVAGHSNTVPALLDLLEAWPDAPDVSKPRPNLGHSEYDRLFVVTLIEGGPARVREFRY